MTTEQKVYGHWVVRDLETGKEVRRITGHHQPGTSTHERAEMGMLRQMDLDRFTVAWEDA